MVFIAFMIIEKRGLLSCLQSKLVMRDKQIVKE